jgi:hypothetical protein
MEIERLSDCEIAQSLNRSISFYFVGEELMTILAAIEPSITTERRPQIMQQHADFYKENGYLVVADALTTTEVDALRMETGRICRGQLGHVRYRCDVSPYSTGSRGWLSMAGAG